MPITLPPPLPEKKKGNLHRATRFSFQLAREIKKGVILAGFSRKLSPLRGSAETKFQIRCEGVRRLEGGGTVNWATVEGKKKITLEEGRKNLRRT